MLYVVIGDSKKRKYAGSAKKKCKATENKNVSLSRFENM